VADGKVYVTGASTEDGGKDSALLRASTFDAEYSGLTQGGESHVVDVLGETLAWVYWRGRYVFRVPR
jgi:hypothetical protein